MGTSQGDLDVLPFHRTYVEGKPAATADDHVPFLNIKDFEKCRSLLNPDTLAATIANRKLTPRPCIPQTFSPWVMGAPTVLVGNSPALDNQSVLRCQYGGIISLCDPAQQKVLIP